MNYYYNNWIRLLSAYEYYYNNNINVIIGKISFNFCLIYTSSMQMNSNIENSTLIGKNPVVREEIEIRIKYIKEYANF
jgi:hypothetical protein